MTQITNGTLKFISPSNYQAGIEGAEVSLSYMIDEGASPEVQLAETARVAALARSTALSMVGKVAVPFVPSSAPLPGMNASTQTGALPGAVVAPIQTPTASPVTAGALPGTAIGSTPQTPSPSSGPSSGPTGLPGAGMPTAPSPGLPGSPGLTVAASPLPGASLPGGAPATVAPVTAENRSVLVQNDPTVVAALPWDDKTVVEHLTHAAQRMAPTHGEHTGPNIMALIQSFIPEGTPMPAGPKCGLIPAEHRQAFLDRLAAL